MKTQVNVRLTDQDVKDLDAVRMKIAQEEGSIPTRSDVVRRALDELIKSYKIEK
ncbi:CopG family transcriptional regulator [Thiomicrorhabdus sp. Milos-T2]|uniref:CopG family transcriptional regulator n=1 Tax=Thiomicrorhabdus sp. Milos-T2 TaxID=90814 RepID=UPI000A673D9C|nr:CopG family transcriptional regulator [Thiomicrorhabdus sp. Milos-T2]